MRSGTGARRAVVDDIVAAEVLDKQGHMARHLVPRDYGRESESCSDYAGRISSRADYAILHD